MSLKALKQQFFKMMLDAPESSSSTPSTAARKVSKHFEIFSLSDSKLVPFKTQIRDFSWFYVIFVERPRKQNIVVDCLTELFLLPEVHLQFYIFKNNSVASSFCEPFPSYWWLHQINVVNNSEKLAANWRIRLAFAFEAIPFVHKSCGPTKKLLEDRRLI